MALLTAPSPAVTDDALGKLLSWRYNTAGSFGVADEIRFPVPFKDATLMLLELADPAAPTVTTFQPAIGYAESLGADGPNRRSQATAAVVAAKSQQRVSLRLRDGYLYLRPVASATCADGVQLAVIVREGTHG